MRRLLIVLAGITVLTVACGDEDDTGGQGSGAATSSGEASGNAPVALEGDVNDHGTEEISGAEVELELDDYYFGPTYLKATPGASVHLKMENEGDDAHTFTSEALGVDDEVAAGESVELDVTLPEEGAVLFNCRFHTDRGSSRSLLLQRR